jgi:hypothetical protein
VRRRLKEIAVGFDAFRARVAELHELLDTLGVEHVFLKTVKVYRHADTNVDVLIPRREAFLRARSELQSRGFRPAWTFEFDKAMLLPPPAERDRPAAHLYSRISWYTVPHLDAQDVLMRARVVPWEGLRIPVPAPDDDYLIGALHAFFEEEALTLGDVWHLTSLRKQLDLPVVLENLQSPTVRWVAARVHRALSEAAPTDINPKRERQIVHTFPEGALLKGFALRIGEALHQGRFGDLLRMLYAYGVIHPAKRLRLIRG